jgi:transcriptional regulator with XRE-family HTH domain
MQNAQNRKILTTFGGRVRKARHALGISQEVLAERTGLHRTYIGTVERGERNPALINVVRIADALAVDAASLTAGLSLSAMSKRGAKR